MGILRKYLWLVLPIVFFANYASADTCENDPYACTPAKLCSKTTEKINNVLYWISSEEDKHLKAARKINLNCGAKDAMSSCQKDASECSILELCEVVTTKEVSATNWNEINPQHVKLAKSFGLDCGVKEAQGINQVNKTNTNKSLSQCDLNPAACVSEELCEKATYGVVGNKNWTTLQVFVEFVKEAKQRGLTCGVKSTSIDKTCSQDVLKCTPFELCKLATKKNANGKNIWSMAEYRKKYIEEAQRRNISCGVNYTKNAKTCSQDVLKCTPSELCDAATYTINKTTDWKVGAYKKYVKEAKRRNISCGVKSISNDKICSQDVLKCTPTELCDAATYTINETTDWKVGAYKKYVKEAKRRNISCGVKSASNNQVKADEKARLTLKAEEKRKADEKARLTLKAEKKRKADEKARLALKAEKKRKADEKARLALKAEKKRKADEKARIALKAEKKRKADEKARIALEAEKKRKEEEKLQYSMRFSAWALECEDLKQQLGCNVQKSKLPYMPKNAAEIFLDIQSNPKNIRVDDVALNNLEKATSDWYIFLKPTTDNDTTNFSNQFIGLGGIVMGCILQSKEEKLFAARMANNVKFYVVGDFLETDSIYIGGNTNNVRKILFFENCKFSKR